MQYVMLYPQNGDRIVTTDSVTSFHPIYIRHLGSHKTLNNYTEKKRKQTTQSFTACSHIRRDIGLHLTDMPIYLNSLQSAFLDAKHYCIKSCRLFSATCLTDWQLNNCIHREIVSSRAFAQRKRLYKRSADTSFYQSELAHPGSRIRAGLYIHLHRRRKDFKSGGAQWW